jgi:uncharacterized protein (TIGR03435 family)
MRCSVRPLAVATRCPPRHRKEWAHRTSAGGHVVSIHTVRWRFALACALIVGTLAVTPWQMTELVAQQPAAQPVFEVTSVKPFDADRQQIGIDLRGLRAGRLAIVGSSLAELVAMAYPHLMGWETRFVGGPPRLMSKRFDVVATFQPRRLNRAAYGPLPDPLPLMLRSLLNDRFKLTAHLEFREQPVYVLRLARKDRALGPNLATSTTECPSKPETSGSNPEKCGIRSSFPPKKVVQAVGVPMLEFVGYLAQERELSDRMIIDETGLDGRYDVKLELGTFRDTISIFTAVKEQLGLQLSPETRSIEVLVIDRVEEPAPN